MSYPVYVLNEPEMYKDKKNLLQNFIEQDC